MYGGIAYTDSEVVFLRLAPDGGRRSLANGSVPLGSTPGPSLGSATFVSTRAVLKPRLGSARLFHFPESPSADPSHRPSPLRQSAPDESCLRDIGSCEAPIAQPSARGSSAPLQTGFSSAATDQEAG